MGLRQDLRRCPFSTRVLPNIDPSLAGGVDGNAVHRVRIGGGDREVRAHRLELQALPLPSVRQAVQRTLRHGAEPDAIPVRRDRARRACLMSFSVAQA